MVVGAGCACIRATSTARGRCSSAGDTLSSFGTRARRGGSTGQQGFAGGSRGSSSARGAASSRFRSTPPAVSANVGFSHPPVNRGLTLPYQRIELQFVDSIQLVHGQRV